MVGVKLEFFIGEKVWHKLKKCVIMKVQTNENTFSLFNGCHHTSRFSNLS